MIKIKVIDLLNKIANGEIETNTELFYKKEKYRHIDNLFENYYVEEVLNDEVEIIEEDKKIRKLDYIEENTFSKRQNGMTAEDRRLLDSNFRELGNKINEIIDYINKE